MNFIRKHLSILVIFKGSGFVIAQVMHVLEVLSETTGMKITEIISPHKEVIAEMVPPKKHLLRYQPPIAQIGIMVIQSDNLYFSYLNTYPVRTKCFHFTL